MSTLAVAILFFQRAGSLARLMPVYKKPPRLRAINKYLTQSRGGAEDIAPYKT